MQAPRVFISYSHADSEFANKLAADLHATGIDVWIDKWKINIGESIVGRINDGIHKSDFLIVVLSNQSVSSRWVLEELNAATVRNVELEKGAFILPVLIEDCPIPELLRHRKYADFRADASSAFRALVAALKQQSLAPFAPLTEIPVSVPDLIQMIRHLPVSERYRYKPEEVHGTLPLWSILLNQHRIIYLGGEIDDTIGNDIVGQLLILSQRDKDKEIHMYIDSPGGSVAASFAIFDTMEFARVP